MPSDSVAPGRWVTVEKRKWDGSVSARYAALLVAGGRDLWAWHTPARAMRAHPWRGTQECRLYAETTVGCGSGWLLNVQLDPHGRALSAEADAVLPPAEVAPGVVAFIDLDLDLVIDLVTSDAVLVDEADLIQRAQEMQYPNHVVQSAWAGIKDIQSRLATRRWPFGGPGRRRAPGEPDAFIRRDVPEPSDAALASWGNCGLRSRGTPHGATVAVGTKMP